MEQDEFDKATEQYKDVVPTPLVDIAKDLGIEVFLTKRFNDSTSGQIQKEGNRYAIYLNANHSYTRNRFTLAHELAHFKYDKNFLEKEEEIEDFKGRTFRIPSSLPRSKDTLHDERERRADSFAAELLMPEEKFVDIWERKATIQEVADFFEVSPEAAETRARVITAKRSNEGSEESTEATSPTRDN